MIALNTDKTRQNEVAASQEQLPVCLGCPVEEGLPLEYDLVRMIHVLVAGQRGSGKSAFVRTLITQLVTKYSPRDLRLVLIDPKLGVDLGVFQVPHLMHPVVEEDSDAAGVLKALVQEVAGRYRELRKAGFIHFVAGRAAGHRRPYIVVVVEELADLLLSRKECVEDLTRLAQKGRAAGVILVAVTQQNSTRSIPSLLLANIPTRICFRVTSRVNSQMVLDCCGAEKLDAVGEFLARSPAFPGIIHGRASYLPPSEIEECLHQVKTNMKDFPPQPPLPMPIPGNRVSSGPARPVEPTSIIIIKWVWVILKSLFNGTARLARCALLVGDTVLVGLERILTRMNRTLHRRPYRSRWKLRWLFK